MSHHHQRITPAVALTLALAAATAPAAWADPAPLAKAGADIANASTHPSASGGPCSEVCSVGGYGSVNTTTRTPASPAACGDVCSGHGYGPVSTPATVVRIAAPGGGFDWGDAGIGAGGAIVLLLIGTGGRLAMTNRRGRHARQQHASVSS